jgi:hypothetical protein
MHLEVRIAFEDADGDEGAAITHAAAFLGAAVGAAGPDGFDQPAERLM